MDASRRFFRGELALAPSYWIGLWALPVAFFVAFERLLWFYLHPDNASWDTGLGYPIFLVFGGPIVVGISLIWSSRAVRKSASRYQVRKAFRDLATFQANATPFLATPLILFLYFFWLGDGLDEVSPDQLVERQGIVYKAGATERYNGYSLLTGVNGVITERWYYVGGYVIHLSLIHI